MKRLLIHSRGGLSVPRSRAKLLGWAGGMALVVTLGLAPAAVAANFTWAGGAKVGVAAWSNAANWSGTAPATGSTGSFLFGVLSSSSCPEPPTSSQTFTCYAGDNDLTGITAKSVDLTPAGEPGRGGYSLYGNAITLSPAAGTDGITGSSPSSSTGAPRPISACRLRWGQTRRGR